MTARSREWLAGMGLGLVLPAVYTDAEVEAGTLDLPVADEYVGQLAKLLRAVRDEEREACAVLAQDVAERVPVAERPTHRTVTAMYIASRIRARGQR